MKRITLPLLFLFLFACTNKEKAMLKPFTSDMLALQLFSIDSGKDTSIKTLHGSVIKIIAGSFNVSGIISLEIKEALTPAEIFAAGLSTESNGRLLKSGGMIFVNGTSKGEPVELIKPIKISIPNQYYDSSMQVFKGVETDSGTVNWIDPQPLDTTEQSINWENGKSLFKAVCASCHSIFRDGTGPAMKDVEYRGPWNDRKNIYSFVRDPGRFMAQDRYTQDLKRKFGSMMTGFPDLSDDDINAVLAYIKNESKRPGALEEERNYYDSISKISFPSDTIGTDAGYFESDSIFNTIQKPCKDDTVYLPILKSDQSFFENADGFQLPPVIDTNRKSGPAKAEDLEGLRGGFTDPNPTSGMYDFEIRTFGWYNIDAYVEGYTGSTNVKLWVQLQVEFDISMHVYLFCPRNKMLSVMNDRRNGKFFFNKINEGIPLFLKDRAILFAFGSKGQKMYYGIKEFRIQGEQTIQINIKETTQEEIKRKLRLKNMEGIDLGIEQKEMKIINNPCDEPQKNIDSTNK
jgi:cytochrome c2